MAGYQEQPPAFGSGISADNPALSTGSSVMFNGTGTRGTTFQINGVNNDDSSENQNRSEEHTSELQSRSDLVCRLLLEKKKPLQAKTPYCYSTSHTNSVHSGAHVKSATSLLSFALLLTQLAW